MNVASEPQRGKREFNIKMTLLYRLVEKHILQNLTVIPGVLSDYYTQTVQRIKEITIYKIIMTNELTTGNLPAATVTLSSTFHCFGC